MRVGVTAFNMEDEKDDGHFDADGNFVWQRGERRVQEDAWLDGVSEDQMGAARHAKVRAQSLPVASRGGGDSYHV